MADYIERAELISEIISDMALFIGDADVVQRHDEQCNYAISCVENAPAADVVPVVRCGSCKYGDYDSENEMYCYHCFGLDDVEPDYYCCHGERKE